MEFEVRSSDLFSTACSLHVAITNSSTFSSTDEVIFLKCIIVDKTTIKTPLKQEFKEEG